jgi:hypothetical protein
MAQLGRWAKKMKSAFTLLGLLICSAAVLPAEGKQFSPKREELIGIWVPDRESMREIESRSKNKASPEIELRSRGGFAVLNIPSWWLNVFGQPAGKFSGIAGGEWAFKEGKNRPELLLEHKAFGVSMVLSIEGQKPPYFLLLHIGGTRDNAPVRFYRSSGELNPPKSEGSVAP